MRIDDTRRRVLENLAESYVEQAGFFEPPIDPFHWCGNQDQIVVQAFDLVGECDGLLVFRNGRFHLLYEKDPRRWRFTVAHEVGHYLIDEHHQAIRSGLAEHTCITGFTSSAEMEREADCFAAALLMPGSLFAPKCPDPNFKAIGRAAETFDVSLTATTLRTLAFTPVRSALFVTSGGKLECWSVTDGVAESGVFYARVGESPPAGSKTAEISADLKSVPTKPIAGGKCYASEWFRSAREDTVLWEEVLPLPRYGKVMTLLTFYGD